MVSIQKPEMRGCGKAGSLGNGRPAPCLRETGAPPLQLDVEDTQVSLWFPRLC